MLPAEACKTKKRYVQVGLSRFHEIGQDLPYDATELVSVARETRRNINIARVWMRVQQEVFIRGIGKHARL